MKMRDLNFLFDDHKDEKQSKNRFEYENVEQLGKTMKTIDYRVQNDKFIENEIRKRVMIDVTPKMKELLTKIDNLSHLDCLCGGDDDVLDLASKFNGELRNEVALNFNL
jgi:hypothetical protein